VTIELQTRQFPPFSRPTYLKKGEGLVLRGCFLGLVLGQIQFGGLCTQDVTVVEGVWPQKKTWARRDIEMFGNYCKYFSYKSSGKKNSGAKK